MTVTDAEVEAAGDAFRRRLELLAAEDMEAWLEVHGLTVTEWWSWVERELERVLAGATSDALAVDMAAAADAIGAGALPAAPALDPALARDPSAPAPACDPAHPGAAAAFPDVRSAARADCGVAALTAVCRFHGHDVTASAIRALLAPGPDGVALIDLARAARALGFHARTVKASRRNLDTLRLPAIVHVDGRHWVVVYGLEPGVVLVSDPARGRLTLDRGEFESRWSGYAALIAPA